MKRFLAIIKDRRGMIGVLTAVSLFMFVGLLAIVIDLGHLHAVRNELQRAAEAGALAGTRALFPLEGYPSVVPAVDPPFCDLGTAKARETAGANLSDGASVTVPISDVVRGWWDWTANTFTPKPASCSLAETNAIQVTARRTEASGGPVFLTLARLFGLESAGVVASATAAVGYVSGLPPGPFNNIAIQAGWLGTLTVGGTFSFSPDHSDNSSWAGPDSLPNINAALLKNWINNNSSPEMPLTGGVNLINGWATSVLMALQSQLGPNSKTYPGYGTGWLVVLPVVNVIKMNQSAPIVALQPVIITNVVPTGGNKRIEFILYGGPVSVIGGTPGGPVSLVWATRPKLVQ